MGGHERPRSDDHTLVVKLAARGVTIYIGTPCDTSMHGMPYSQKANARTRKTSDLPRRRC